MLFEVEDTRVGDECLEAFLVMTSQPVYREAAERGTYTTQAVSIYIGLLGHLIDSGEVILHALATIVATDGLVPLKTESGEAATVRSHDDIVMGSHDLEVPAVAPELAHGSLRTTFAEEQSGVFLLGVEVWRIDDPCEHLLAIGGRHPSRFHLAALYLVVDVLVFGGELGEFLALCGCEAIDLISLGH